MPADLGETKEMIECRRSGHCWHLDSVDLSGHSTKRIEVCCWCGGQRGGGKIIAPNGKHGEFEPGRR